jgi:RecJ-like exonuclease
MDNVKCCNCEFDGLVDFGEEKCPKCNFVGALAWKDDEEQEVNNG